MVTKESQAGAESLSHTTHAHPNTFRIHIHRSVGHCIALHSLHYIDFFSKKVGQVGGFRVSTFLYHLYVYLRWFCQGVVQL
jgi:hypothetical protein